MKLYKEKEKPIPVEAMQFEYTNKCIARLHDWMGLNMGDFGKARRIDAKGWLHVLTLEDGEGNQKVAHIATEGDYIVKGSFGEFWPVKKHIFEETYEEVEWVCDLLGDIQTNKPADNNGYTPRYIYQYNIAYTPRYIYQSRKPYEAVE